MKPGDRLHAGVPTPSALWARIADSELRVDHLTLSVDEVRELAGMMRGAVEALRKAESDELSAAVERTASIEALNAAAMSAGRAQGYRAGAIRVRQALGMSIEDVAPQHFAPLVPPWVRAWFGAGDTGTSSITIATVMLDLPFELTLQRKRGSAPHDNGDVGRCVRLLDHAAEHGVDWRARLHELVARVPEWAPLVPRWTDIETAYREDEAAHRAWKAAGHDRNLREQGRKLVHGPGYVKPPPLRCYHLVSILRGCRDPYAGEPVPWPRETRVEVVVIDESTSDGAIYPVNKVTFTDTREYAEVHDGDVAIDVYRGTVTVHIDSDTPISFEAGRKYTVIERFRTEPAAGTVLNAFTGCHMVGDILSAYNHVNGAQWAEITGRAP